MVNEKIAIVTVTWARNEREEAALRLSLQRLSNLGLPLFITDGGSPEAFLRFLYSLPNAQVFKASGLWPQARKSLAEAAKTGASQLFYTEPDKAGFFQHLPGLLKKIDATKKDVVWLASRSAKGFASFPSFQQLTENAINACCRELTGCEVDYCYGPLGFPSRLLPFLDRLPADCGWGWRPFLFVLAHRLGCRLQAVEGDFFCPPEQQADDEQERIYRIRQLAQNFNGILLAKEANLGL